MNLEKLYLERCLEVKEIILSMLSESKTNMLFKNKCVFADFLDTLYFSSLQISSLISYLPPHPPQTPNFFLHGRHPNLNAFGIALSGNWTGRGGGLLEKERIVGSIRVQLVLSRSAV